MDPDAYALAATRTLRRPLVRARIGGQPRWVLIDTGSSQGLTLTGLHELALAEGPVPTGARVRVDGLHLLRSAVLAGQVFLGPLHLIRPVVHESPRMDLVGTRVLRHFAVTFDQRSGLVGFTRPGAEVAEPLPPDTLWSLGMAVRARATAHEVLSVFPGSPAALAGIAPGDRIVEADGRPLHGERCEAAPASPPPPPPRPVRLMVERAGARQEVRVAPVAVVGG
jgi:membrane-associated protease RseP (regulator of RpoE activity)